MTIIGIICILYGAACCFNDEWGKGIAGIFIGFCLTAIGVVM